MYKGYREIRNYEGRFGKNIYVGNGGHTGIRSRGEANLYEGFPALSGAISKDIKKMCGPESCVSS